MPLVAGVDSSTQSTTIEIRDGDNGALIAKGSHPHPRTTPPRSEQHPHVWAEAFAAAWAKATSQISGSGFTPADVFAISVAGQQHGLVPLDDQWQPLRAAKLWNDTESASDAADLIDQYGAEVWAKAVGSVPVAAFTIAKLSWLHRNEPEIWSKVRHICLPHDWMNLHLCGEFRTDRGDASGTGYWSPETGEYELDALELIDPDVDFLSMLPKVANPTEPIGHWGQIVVAPGTGDNMAAALGVGLETNQTAVSIGTSGTVFRRSSTPTSDETGAVAGFADATGQYLPLVCTLNATKVTDQVAKWLGTSLNGLNRISASANSDAGGLTLLPYFDGERTPNRPDASGHIVGLRSDTTRESLAQAAFNGVVCGLLDALDALDSQVQDSNPSELYLVGGGTESSSYQRTLANLSGRRVGLVDGADAAARGAAIQAAATLAGCGLDQVRDYWDLPQPKFIEPDESVDFTEIRERYASVRDSTE